MSSTPPYRKPLGVGQVASICRVSKKTVLNWIYEGALKAFTTYGGHYRIWPVNLKKFLDASGMDIPFEYVDETVTHILIMDDEKPYAQMLKSVISSDLTNAEVVTAEDAYEALLLIGERRPHLLIMNSRMPGVNVTRILELLRRRKSEYGMKILVMTRSGNTGNNDAVIRAAADALLDRSADVGVLARTVADVIRSDIGSLQEILTR